jgi:hypothetical protein
MSGLTVEIRGHPDDKGADVVEHKPRDQQAKHRQQGPTQCASTFRSRRDCDLGKAFGARHAAFMLGDALTAEVAFAARATGGRLAPRMMQAALMN